MRLLILILVVMLFPAHSSATDIVYRKSWDPHIINIYKKLLSAAGRKDYNYVRNNIETYENDINYCNNKNSYDKSICLGEVKEKYSADNLEKTNLFKWINKDTLIKSISLREYNHAAYAYIDVIYKTINNSPRLLGKAIKSATYIMPASYSNHSNAPLPKKASSLKMTDFNFAETDFSVSEVSRNRVKYWIEPIKVKELKAVNGKNQLVISWKCDRLTNIAIVIGNKKIAEFTNITHNFNNGSSEDSAVVDDIKLLSLVKRVDSNTFQYEIAFNSTEELKWPNGIIEPFDLKLFLFDSDEPPQEKWISIIVKQAVPQHTIQNTPKEIDGGM